MNEALQRHHANCPMFSQELPFSDTFQNGENVPKPAY
jgi:hypothetical protein